MSNSDHTERLAEAPLLLVVNGAAPSGSEIVSVLQQLNISVASITAEDELEEMPKVSPDLVVLNLDDLNLASALKVTRLRRYGAAILCTIPRQESLSATSVEMLAADDFIFRPFHPEDFICRVQILLRRFGRLSRARPVVERRKHERRRAAPSSSEAGDTPPLTIDDRRKVVAIKGREVRLTPKEYGLLALLASEAGRVFSSEEIVRMTWCSAERASLNDVQQYVHRLRRKLEVDAANPRWIITVKGFGYKLAQPVDH